MMIPYKCSCMSEEAFVEVKAREPEEDVTEWMKTVIVAISGAHKAHNPTCRAVQMEYAKIPLDGTDYIGQEPRLN